MPRLRNLSQMKTRSIQLSQGKVVIVDECDFEWLSQWPWCAQLQSDGITYYAVRSDDRYHLYMHRAILGLNKGDGRYADHINLNTLDNRRVNLRVASPKDSAFNRGMRSDNTSGLKGVSRHKGG